MERPRVKIDRDALRKKLLAEFKLVFQKTADAVDQARPGKIIRDTELVVHEAVREFGTRLYEAAVQAQVDAAEAASPLPRNAEGKPLRNKGRQRAGRLTINGRVVLLRRRWHAGGEGSVAPADFWLDEREASVS